MAQPKHFTDAGFYRPEQYLGPWAILPDRLTAYLAIINSCDLAALAASAAAKREQRVVASAAVSAVSPSEPLPTEKPDVGDDEEKDGTETKAEDKDSDKDALEAEIDEKEKQLAESEQDIADSEKSLQERKDAKSESDEEEIKTSEEELTEKKSACDKLRTEIDESNKRLAAFDDDMPVDDDEIPDDEIPAGEIEDEEDAGKEAEPTAEETPEEKKKREEEAVKPEAHALGAAAPDPHDVERVGRSATFEGYELHGDTAVIEISGPITKHPTSFGDMMGGASTVQTRHAIRSANADAAVQRICLRLESPGGTVAGVLELMNDVRASTKPVWAYAEDTCASAAYFVACMAQYVACNPTAMLGSVGTLVVLQDTSGKYAADGIKVHVLGTGTWKGAGMDGAEITPEQVAYFQHIVNTVNKQFVPAVAAARKLTAQQLNIISEAGVYIGQDAVAAGLVDAVMSFETFLAKFEAETGAAVMEAKTLTERYEAGRTAARAEFLSILGACDGNAVLAAKLYGSGKTIEDAKAARLDSITAELALLKATGVHADDGQPGPVALGKGGSGDTVENQFMALVKEEKEKTGCNNRDAISRVSSRNPQLHEEWKATMLRIEAVAPKENPAPPAK